ncbi:MAG: hypothetical protein AAGH41_10670 [Pseudomonadota bacterium]
MTEHRPTIKWIALGVCLAAGIAIGVLTDSLSERDNPGLFLLLTGVAGTVVLLPATILYWRSLDELAREAHKSSWYWGGSLGLVATLPVLIVFIETIRRDGLDLKELEPEIAMLMGVSGTLIVVLGGMLLGYLLAWGIFWFRKR